MNLHDRFFDRFDHLRPTVHYVSALLERGVRVLIYAGEYDFIANWIGNARWTEALEWSGAEVYRKVNLREWEVDGKTVGVYKRSGELAFASIRAAGHMVCRSSRAIMCGPELMELHRHHTINQKSH